MKVTPIDPQFQTIDEAMEKAKTLADISTSAQTVVVEIVDSVPRYYVLFTAAYAELREKKLADGIAPVASILPNGKVELYMKEFGRFANV